MLSQCFSQNKYRPPWLRLQSEQGQLFPEDLNVVNMEINVLNLLIILSKNIKNYGSMYKSNLIKNGLNCTFGLVFL